MPNGDDDVYFPLAQNQNLKHCLKLLPITKETVKGTLGIGLGHSSQNWKKKK